MTRSSSPPEASPSPDSLDYALNQIAKLHKKGFQVVPFVGAGLSVASGFPTVSQTREYLDKVEFYFNEVIPSPYAPASPRDLINQDTKEPYCGRDSQRAFSQGLKLPRSIPYSSKRVLKSRIALPSEREKRSFLQEYLRNSGWPDPHQLETDLWNFFDSRKNDLPPDPRGARPTLKEQISVVRGGKESLGWLPLCPEKSREAMLLDAMFKQFDAGRTPSEAHVYLTHLIGLWNVPLVVSCAVDTLLEQTLQAERLDTAVVDVPSDSFLPLPRRVGATRTLLKLRPTFGGSGRVRPSRRGHKDSKRIERLVASRQRMLVVLGFSGNDARIMNLIRTLLRAEPNSTKVFWFLNEWSDALDKLAQDFPGQVNSVWICDVATALREIYSRSTSTHPASRTSYELIPRCVSERILIAQPRKAEASSDAGVPTGPPVNVFLNRELLGARDPVGRYESLRFARSSFTSMDLGDFTTRLERARYVPLVIDLEQVSTVEGVINEILTRLQQYDPGVQPLVLPIDLSPDDAKSQHSLAVLRIHDALRRGKYCLSFDQLEGFGRAAGVHHGLAAYSDYDPPQREQLEDTLALRVKSLCEFLKSLCLENPAKIASPLGESFIAIAVDIPSVRHYRSENTPPPSLMKVWDRLAQFVEEIEKHSTVRVERATTADRDGFDVIQFEQLLQTSIPRSPAATDLSEPPVTTELLIQFLQDPSRMTEPNQPGTWPWSYLALTAMSVFRCPRSIVALRTVLVPTSADGRETFASPDALKKQQLRRYERLDRLLDKGLDGLCRRTEGATYWLPRAVHETVYDNLTLGLRKGEVTGLCDDLDALKGKPSPEGLAAKFRDHVARLVFLAGTHRRACRYYFTFAWVHARDPKAFFEYLYHRVSSLRYLKYLQMLIEKVEQLFARSELEAILGGAGAVGRDWIRYIEDRKEVEAEADEPKVLSDYVRRRRYVEIRALQETLVREKQSLQATHSADDWLRWIEEHTGDSPLDSLTDEERPLLASGGRCSPILGGILEEYRQILDLLEDERFSLHRDRGDYARAVEVLLRRLGAAPDVGDLTARVKAAKRIDSLAGLGAVASVRGLRRIGWQIDLADCLAMVGDRHGAIHLNDRILQFFDTELDDAFRLAHPQVDRLRVRAEISRIFAVLGEAHAGYRHSSPDPELREALRWANRAQDFTRSARFPNPEEYHQYRARLGLLQAQLLSHLGNAVAAESHAEMARSALNACGSDQSFALGRASLIDAEILLQSCIDELSSQRLPGTVGKSPKREQAKTKNRFARLRSQLSRAEQMLQSAESVLVRARRATRWWFRLQLARARLTVLWLESVSTCRPTIQDFYVRQDDFLVEVEHYLRAGLRAIRSGLNSFPRSFPPKTLPGWGAVWEDANRISSWLLRATFLGGYFVATMTRETPRGKGKPAPGEAKHHAAEHYWNRWEWLCRGAGFHHLISDPVKEAFVAELHSLKDKFYLGERFLAFCDRDTDIRRASFESMLKELSPHPRPPRLDHRYYLTTWPNSEASVFSDGCEAMARWVRDRAGNCEIEDSRIDLFDPGSSRRRVTRLVRMPHLRAAVLAVPAELVEEIEPKQYRNRTLDDITDDWLVPATSPEPGSRAAPGPEARSGYERFAVRTEELRRAGIEKQHVDQAKPRIVILDSGRNKRIWESLTPDFQGSLTCIPIATILSSGPDPNDPNSDRLRFREYMTQNPQVEVRYRNKDFDPGSHGTISAIVAAQVAPRATIEMLVCAYRPSGQPVVFMHSLDFLSCLQYLFRSDSVSDPSTVIACPYLFASPWNSQHGNYVAQFASIKIPIVFPTGNGTRTDSLCEMLGDPNLIAVGSLEVAERGATNPTRTADPLAISAFTCRGKVSGHFVPTHAAPGLFFGGEAIRAETHPEYPGLLYGTSLSSVAAASLIGILRCCPNRHDSLEGLIKEVSQEFRSDSHPDDPILALPLEVVLGGNR